MRDDTHPVREKWPCDICGGEGARNIGAKGYCWYHLRELVATFDTISLEEGFGIPVGGAEDVEGARLFPLQCVVCDASWLGSPFEGCWWCQQHLERLFRYQRDLVLRPPENELADRARENALRAWAKRLENAVQQNVITEEEAKNALARELRRTE